MRKTFQTVELPNNFWQVVCIQTNEEIQRCETKEYAVRMVARLNRKFNKR